MYIIAGSSNPPLAKKIANKLGTTTKSKKFQLIPIEISKFANDEKRIWINDNQLLKNQEVCLIQSFNAPVDEHIIETLLIIDALERLGAKSVTLIIPWLGYSLQDKVFRPGEAIAAKVVADVISNHFVERVFLLDLHNSSIPGFFSVPTYHLFADEIFINYLKKAIDFNQALIASPDFGGIKRARIFAEKVGLDMVNIDKSRDLKTGQVTAHDLHGPSVENKTVVVIDDVIISGSTVIESAALLKKKGARKVYFVASHGVFCNGLAEINNSEVDQIVVSNSIQQKQKNAKLKVLDISSIFAQELLH
ncbi:ribose-phosphate pyrophosphokinase [Candidatus Woesebacteria bacterium]|jgi:ribose-phosphate pyrophosphokinase|nr:ribose-phosphate pyrophosphokinase [Candidatus Woesebacteria bacterium]HOA11730.1 ribose-phosphate pyrophosphokinase [Candidatus Woesebacteria bacterium]HOP39267.1 ribose-phosphate pyrophosphokinase [Candidatus Woesebacteria bacterium]HPA61731.1 ribose-phosphate pyrophosphokinase [Candidatus Woesebacteria bacterium]HPK08027.1 ribose-phosphate pyrophosphokinase [Candidatus Woesebacteria bacterium]